MWGLAMVYPLPDGLDIGFPRNVEEGSAYRLSMSGWMIRWKRQNGVANIVKLS
jgi:hypothetical protein